MLSKKLLVGAAVMALAVSTAAVAYAAGPQYVGSPDGVQYQETVSISGEGGLSFDEIDKDNLPEGVFYQDKISIDAADGIPLK